MDFENGFRFEVMTSTALTGKAPKGFDWARYYKTFQTAVLTPRQLASHVWHGYAFTPVWHTARREGNFVSAGHMAFDFDAGDETSSLDALMAAGTFAWMFSSFAYSTPSSTSAAPRSRVVYVLEFPIRDARLYREAYQAVAWWMAGDGAVTDPACKDALRLYYGSRRGEVKANWSVLGTTALDYVITQYRAAHPAPADAPTRLRVVDPAPSVGMKERKLRHIGEAVRNAPQNEGHATLLKRAREAGGYVASGAFTEDEAAAELVAAAMSRPWADDQREIERVVRDGLRYGVAAPLYFEKADSLKELLR